MGTMLDRAFRMWLVVENEQDKKWMEDVKKKTLDIHPYKSLKIKFKHLKPFLTFNYLQIGYLGNNEDAMLSGFKYINGDKYQLCNFKPETTINMMYFKPFWKQLTKNFKIHSKTDITIHYYQNEPVWFEVSQFDENGNEEKRIGIILPSTYY
jgi:hypothetical protein